MVTDGPTIHMARKLAFEIVERDPNLKNESNKMIREMFILDYSDRLEDISLS